MANPVQQQIWGFHGSIGGQCDKCLVREFIEQDDNACQELVRSNYETLSCGTDKGLSYLLAVRGPTLLNIKAKELNLPSLPQFIPHGFSRSSNKYLRQTNLPWIAVTLGKIINSKTLEVVPDVRSYIGVDNNTRIFLLNYADDSLIERIWDNRNRVLPALAQTNVDLMTSIDYSVFLDQPHLESVVNIKRGFVTYDLLSEYGAKVMPHVYWRGNTSIKHISEWININPHVTHIASYQGLRKSDEEWDELLVNLRYLKSLLRREVILVISGPSLPSRIAALLRVWPTAVITNGVAVQNAIHHVLQTSDSTLSVKHQPLIENIEYYNHLVEAEKAGSSRLFTISPPTASHEATNRWRVHTTSHLSNIHSFLLKGGDKVDQLPRNQNQIRHLAS